MTNNEQHQQLYNMLQEDSALAFDNECVRKKLNLSKSSTPYKFDNPNFSPDELLDDIKTRSPKLVALLENIEKLDKMDMKKDGHTYKHFIFSDLKSSSSGAKLIASAMIAKGYHIGYKLDETSKKMELIPEKKLLNDDLDKTQNENIYLLSSTGVYDQPITVTNKKEMLKTYNKRPDNIHGDLIRFIIMDSGYKEGIDLFDIKYIHIFEPSVTSADQKQVIGRGTRTCGQKGLEFHPTMGWPLHVFVYDYEFPEKLRPSLLNTTTGIELYMKSMNMDFRLLNFTYDIENIIIEGSVDYDLNKNIHSFSISDTSTKTGGTSGISGISGGTNKISTTSKRENPVLDVIQNIPAEPMKFKEHQKYIAENFGDYAWDHVKMENLCLQKGGAELIHFTPTQSFIRHYFTPENPTKIKGMLLNHSVGSGKTCSAIAAASSSFEEAGYTILWVTRTTLKSDIWKNMFDQICNEQIRKMVQNGVEIHEDNKKRMRLLSKAWRIRPLSYKQFSNLVSKENAYYDTLVKINGPEDPLRKTLIIIDEAHKLYGGSLSTIEQPDMDALHKAVMNSYIVSGEHSVKILLMTATPISKSPMELIQLLNLFKLPDQQIPRHFDTFREKYLDEDGHFTKKGHDEFLDVIAGHISYLNREKDARQFSQPQITKINIPIVKDLDEIETFDKRYVRAYLESDILPLKKEIEDNRVAIDDNIALVDKDDFAFLKERCNIIKNTLTVENKKAKRECVKIVNANIREMVKEMNEEKSGITQHMKELRETIKNANLFKREKMAEITDNHENLEEGFSHYKESVYYNLRSKCGKNIRTMKDLDQLLKSNPEFAYYTEEIQKYDNRIQELQTHLKDSIERYKNKIKRIKNMLKMDYNSLEKSVLRMVIKDERKYLRNYTAKETKKVDNEIKTLKVSLKKAEKTRKKYFGNLRKSVKKEINADKNMAKKTRKVEQKLEKQMKREQGIRIDTEDKVAKELVERYGKIIDLEIEEAVAEIEEEEQEKVRKIQEKTDEKLRKIQERETRKKEKADAIAIEKTRKAHAIAIEKAMRKTKKNKPV